MRFIRAWRTNLTVRLVTTFLCVSLLAIGLLGGITLFTGTALIRNAVFNQLDAAARFKENEIERWINDQQAEVALLARSEQVRSQAAALIAVDGYSRETIEQERQELNSLLLPFVTIESNFKEIFILHVDTGKVVFSTTNLNEGDFHVTAPYFTEGKKALYIQNIYPSPITLEPTMTIAAPIYNEQERTVGVIAVNLNLARLDQIVREDIGFGSSSESYLVDRYNDMVSQQEIAPSTIQRGIFTEGINAALREQDGLGMYENYAGVPVIGAYRWVDNHELILVAEVAQSEALAPARQLAWIITGVAIIVTICMTVIIVFLGRRITRPIKALTLSTQHVAQGDLAVRTPVMTNDELGTLAASFNTMTDQLQQLYTGLEHHVEDLAMAQEKLRLSEAKYRSFIEHAPEGIFQIDHTGEWLTANPAMAQLCGYSNPELLMSRIRLEHIFVEPDVHRVLQRQLLRDDWVSNFETRFYHRDGYEFWVNLAIRAVYEFATNTTYYEGIVHNVTIRKEAEQELQVYHDQLEEQVVARTRDLQSTNDELKRVALELHEKNIHLQQGLRLAHDIQLGLLPEHPPWDASRLAAFGQSLPSDEVGGDFYSFVRINDDEVFVAVGDISGKGVGAALMMALTGSLVEERAHHDEPVSQMLASLDEQLTPRLQANHMNAALVCMRINLQTYEVQVANAGMISPVVVHQGRLRYIDVVGPPVGSRLPMIRNEVSFTLEPGAYVMLMSDGVVEATNMLNKMWSFERFEAAMLFHAQQDNPAGLVDEIFREVSVWIGDSAAHDDITLVLLHRPEI